jgi:DNA polymerase-1
MLKKLSSEFAQEILAIEKEIYKISGEEFNIGSPKQLSEILFDKLKFPKPKKTSKTENYSTAVEVLEDLSKNGFIIADYILNWRQITKLKNTYSDALPEQINPQTKRIHSYFSQTGTSTSRLTSSNPNLQNIPIRSSRGNKIRAAFIARPGCKLLSADYSQIELRLLAHMASIETLIDAFNHGKDIHTETACKIFKVSAEGVTDDFRRAAKAINFGIIYGISPYGLSKQLDISVTHAGRYIEEYFALYPGIKDYMDHMIDFAKRHGYVENLYGRKCFTTQIASSNYALRNFAERAAINAPLQSTSSEITKRAIIEVNEYLVRNQYDTRLLLQIHDELLFEVPEAEIPEVSVTIKEIMQNVIHLKVPLIVGIELGDNWHDMLKL